MPLIKPGTAPWHWSQRTTANGSTLGEVIWKVFNNEYTVTNTGTTVSLGYGTGTANTVTNSCTWQLWNSKTENMLRQQLIQAANYLAEYQQTWVTWNTDHLVANQIANNAGVVQVQVVAAPPPTPEQQAALERVRVEEQRRWQEDQRRIEAEKNEAKEKAYKLLDSALDNQQREELKTKGFFHCRSKQGNLYRIYRGSHGNVKKVVNNKEVEKYCIQPHYVPEGDCMLAQKLHIENDEDSFIRTANITRLN